MSKPEIVYMSNLSGEQRLFGVIRQDMKNPHRIFCDFPPYSSLSHEEAIAIANRLADVIEGSG